MPGMPPGPVPPFHPPHFPQAMAPPMMPPQGMPPPFAPHMGGYNTTPSPDLAQDMRSPVPKISPAVDYSLWIGNLPPDFDDDLMKQIVESVEPDAAHRALVRWKRVADPETGKKKSFGFATYFSNASASRALRLLHTLSLGSEPGTGIPQDADILMNEDGRINYRIEQNCSKKEKDVAQTKDADLSAYTGAKPVIAHENLDEKSIHRLRVRAEDNVLQAIGMYHKAIGLVDHIAKQQKERGQAPAANEVSPATTKQEESTITGSVDPTSGSANEAIVRKFSLPDGQDSGDGSSPSVSSDAAASISEGGISQASEAPAVPDVNGESDTTASKALSTSPESAAVVTPPVSELQRTLVEDAKVRGILADMQGQYVRQLCDLRDLSKKTISSNYTRSSNTLIMHQPINTLNLSSNRDEIRTAAEIFKREAVARERERQEYLQKKEEQNIQRLREMARLKEKREAEKQEQERLKKEAQEKQTTENVADTSGSRNSIAAEKDDSSSADVSNEAANTTSLASDANAKNSAQPRRSRSSSRDHNSDNRHDRRGTRSRSGGRSRVRSRSRSRDRDRYGSRRHGDRYYRGRSRDRYTDRYGSRYYRERSRTRSRSRSPDRRRDRSRDKNKDSRRTEKSLEVASTSDKFLPRFEKGLDSVTTPVATGNYGWGGTDDSSVLREQMKGGNGSSGANTAGAVGAAERPMDGTSIGSHAEVNTLEIESNWKKQKISWDRVHKENLVEIRILPFIQREVERILRADGSDDPAGDTEAITAFITDELQASDGSIPSPDAIIQELNDVLGEQKSTYIVREVWTLLSK